MKYYYLEQLTGFEISNVLEIFPEAVAVLNHDLLTLKEEVVDYEKELFELRKLLLKGINNMKFDNPEYKKLRIDFATNFFYRMPIQKIESMIRKLEHLIRIQEWKRKPADGEITDTEIAKAKESPMNILFPEKPNYQGFMKCPFHQEDTPSFKIYEKDNRWHCFGCGEGGDTIDFIIKRDNISFIQAVKKIIT